MNNAFLNVHSGKVADGRSCSFCPDITQEQYEQVLLANLRQLWTDYGELAEVWFDGGVPSDVSDPLASLLEELQPNAVAFQGPGSNGIRYCGTESGHVAYPFWSTAKSSKDKGAGSPDGAVFAPGESDTCFQGGRGNGPYGGCWFYNHGMVPKSLPELVGHYHDTVGRNAFSLLDWTPTQDGDIRADHLQRYEEYGDWLRGCYSVPVASVGPVVAGEAALLSLPEGSQFDRLVIQEDLSKGEFVRSYKVALDGTDLASGSSVGHKRIVLLNNTMSGQELSVSFSSESNSASLAHIAAFNCSSTPEPEGCSFQQAFRYKIVDDITLSTTQGSSPQACCEACRAESECAVFVLDTDKTCTLLSANQGGDAEDGVLSGSPKGGLFSAAAAFV
jgi:alpha-L-fucosidase